MLVEMWVVVSVLCLAILIINEFWRVSMNLNLINQIRNRTLLVAKVQDQLAKMQLGQTKVNKGRPITDETPLEVKARIEFRSRQTYRAHVRAWAKQQIRFVNAYTRGDLAPHLHYLVQ